MKLGIPWIKTGQAEAFSGLPVQVENLHPAGEWDHTAQLDLHEAETTLGELREMWQQEKARRDQGHGLGD